MIPIRIFSEVEEGKRKNEKHFHACWTGFSVHVADHLLIKGIFSD